MTRPLDSEPTALDRAFALIADRLPPDHAPQALAFARHFYREVDPADLEGRDPVDLYGAAVSLWRFARERAPGESRLRLFNPKADEHGWQCPHTVLEIVQPDMPFLVDSVRMQVNAQGFVSHLIIHPVIPVRRGPDGALTTVVEPDATDASAEAESCMHVELSRETDPDALRRLERAVRQSLTDVRAAVVDWSAMRERMRAIADEARTDPPVGPSREDVAEGVALLDWLVANRFTFLGCRDYDLVEGSDGAALRIVPGSGLGILRDDRSEAASTSFATLPHAVRQRARQPEFLVLTRSNSRATVHRPSYADYIGIKRFSATGAVIGERRFLGLYTSIAYRASVSDIPIVRRKVESVLARSGVAAGSHKGKGLVTILETYPRDELFQITPDELLRISMGILHLDERQRTRLFLRRDPFGRFVSCLVYVPRDNYNTEVRERIQAVLINALDGLSSEFSVSLSESVLARVLIVIQTRPHAPADYDEAALEAALVQTVRRWEDDLADALVTRFGEEIGTDLFRKYGDAFPAGYREDCLPRMAVHDIELMETLAGPSSLALNLHAPLESLEGDLRFRLLHPGQAVPISDVLPVLERMGVRVMAERPYEIEPRDAERIWIHDMALSVGGLRVDVDDVRPLFHEAFQRVWRGEAESDSLNQLVLRAGLGWREVSVLRALMKYARQTGVAFTHAYMESALTSHPDIARQLVDLFMARHDPRDSTPPADRGAAIAGAIEEALGHVPSLDEDRILRRLLAEVMAVTRTNYFQRGADGDTKPYVSMKFDPSRIPGLPEPRPAFEIYVYAPAIEGVHLRGGRVARGGLRWSDRMEDFRTEVLGLMKAQMIKNAVIVPVGAKGGFVVKRPPAGADRDTLMREVVACYKTFLRGLLDLTGSRGDRGVIPPPDVVRHDDDDTYLVVAADKGTATFSDIANEVAAEYRFWLGDAFASGGSAGYDHKKIGITARGAWESVKKHFRGLGVDIQTTDFTVAGIGDMSGDVFGNGMLLSRHIRLVAAFDHRHVFLDPDPDPASSHDERARLFQLPRSSWADYKRDRISAGGGVFPRSAKSIPISPEVRARLAIDAESLTPHDLIRAILRAPVDLLYNGGIGTYVKARDETHAAVGDRSNDGVRVDATELRCKVVGEGGNLGFTQAARVEFALAGGRIHTDAIDNSAGVDCSDHEVNIKILLNAIVAEGRLTTRQRNELLSEMTDEVASLVLRDNYSQAQALAIGSARSPELFDLHVRLIRDLERRGALNREVEGLPDDEALTERRASATGLSAPERAVLLAHAKLWLFDQLLASTVPEDELFGDVLTEYFPRVLRERYAADMATHPLRREITATVVANHVVNRMGSTFVHRLVEQTGAAPADVVRAFVFAETVFALDDLWARIDALDNQIPDALQTTMHIQLVRMMLRGSLWFVRRSLAGTRDEASLSAFTDAVSAVASALPTVLGERDRERLARAWAEYVESGVPEALARRVAGVESGFAALDICDVATQARRPVDTVIAVYFRIAERLDAAWLWERIGNLPSGTHWQVQARAALRDELEERMRSITQTVLAREPGSNDVDTLVSRWEHDRPAAFTRVRQLLGQLQADKRPDLAMLSVALRELRLLG